MVIFDTLSGEKKELPTGREIKMFVCGPTVYDYPHIGNARTFVFFDMFAKYLRSTGIKLTYLQNITDIDDKIIQKAKDEGTSWREVSKKYEEIYRANLEALGMDTQHMQFARATDYVPEIIAQVKHLHEKGFSYLIEGDGWYFDISKYAGYGELAHRTVQQAEDGVTRIDDSSKKKNAGDFCLWKLSDDPTLQLGDDGLGAGRPGWHIEDTAITEKFFGPQYDIHGGAIDLKFPHHEAERAQQEAASGKLPFVNFWMHAGFLTIDGKKMSKSLGNFMTVDDLLTKMTPDEFRMMLLMHHYRSPLDYTEQAVKMAKDSIHYFMVRVQNLKNQAASNENEKEFEEAMNDDFNTPRALATLRSCTDPAVIAKNLASLGINITVNIPPDVQVLLQKRELSRASKQFEQSDALRKEIEGLGYIVEDTPVGPLVLPKN